MSEAALQDDGLVEALVSQAKILSEERYSFWAPTPETHDKVIARLADERGNGDAKASSSKERIETLSAASLQDVFGWSMPLETDSQLMSLIHPTLRQRLSATSISDKAVRSPARFSTLYPSSGYTSSAQSLPILYAHSSWPTKDEKNAIFFGPDTYRFLSYLTTSFAKYASGRRFKLGVDVGCGAGAGAIHLANQTNVQCQQVIGLDINPKALLFARANARIYANALPTDGSSNKTEGKPNWRISNLLSALSDAEKEMLDIVISNPPYIAFDPTSGGGSTYADGGDQKGLALPILIAREAISHLSSDGLLILYTGVPISLNGSDPLHDTLHEDRFFAEQSEVLNYEVLDVDCWGDELRDARGSYGGSDVGQIAIVGVVLRKK